MDALSLINSKLDVELLLNHYSFDKMHNDGNFIRSCCGIHDGDGINSFVINTETGLWYCHTSCGGGDAFTLIQKKEKLSFPQAVHWLAKFTGVDVSDMEIIERKADYMKEIIAFTRMMRKRSAKVNESAFTIAEQIRQVTTFRNFHVDTLRHFQLGFVEQVELMKRDGTSTYNLRNRLVIPNFINGVQHMLSFRSTRPSDVPKWSLQPVGVETGNYLYNLDNARYASSITVVEGLFDVWAYHEIGIPAVATYGAHLTNEQYSLLLKTGADIVLSYDGDKAGREATQKAIKLLKNKVNLSCVLFDEGQDPESITRQELKERYDRKKIC